jgi:hypothetical protein
MYKLNISADEQQKAIINDQIENPTTIESSSANADANSGAGNLTSYAIATPEQEQLSTGDIPSPIVSVHTLFARTPEENIKADVNAIKAGNWSQVGYVPHLTTKEYTEKAAKDFVKNPLVQIAGVMILGEATGGIADAVLPSLAKSAIPATVGRMFASSLAYLSKLPVVGGSVNDGIVMLNSGIPVFNIVGGYTIDLASIIKNTAVWGTAGTVLDVGTKALVGEKIDPVKTAQEQYGTNAALFTFLPMALRSAGFTFSKAGDVAKWGFSNTLGKLDNEYINMAQQHIFNFIGGGIKRPVADFFVDSIYKPMAGTVLQTNAVIKKDFIELLKDHDFVGLVMRTAVHADEAAGGNGFTAGVAKNLEDMSKAGSKAANELNSNPITMSAIENIMLVAKNKPLPFDDSEYVETAKRVFQNNKTLFELPKALSGYWEKFVVEHMGLSPALPNHIEELIRSGEYDAAVAATRNEKERLILSDLFSKAKLGVSKDAMPTIAKNIHTMLYENAMGSVDSYVTRMGLVGSKEIEQNLPKDDFGWLSNLAEQASREEINVSQLKKRKFPTLFERLVKDPGIKFMGGWNAQKSFATSVMSGAEWYGLANGIKNLVKQAVDRTGAGEKFNVSYNFLKWWSIENSTAFLSDVIKTKGGGALVPSLESKMMMYYPTVADKPLFKKLEEFFANSVGEKLIDNHYVKINFGEGDYYIDKRVSEFIGRIMPALRGDVSQILSPLKGVTKAGSALKALKLSFSVIHIGALTTASMGIGFGGTAVKTLSELIGAEISKSSEEYLNEELLRQAKYIDNFLRGVDFDVNVLTGASVPTSSAELGKAIEWGEGFKKFMGSLPGVSKAVNVIPGAKQVLEKGAGVIKGLTIGLEDFLWNKLVPLLKLNIKSQIISKGIEAGLTKQEIYEKLNVVEDALGGQSLWHMLTPTSNALLRLLAFAPDWYLTLIKHVTKSMDGTPEFAMFIPRVVSTSMIIGNAISIAMTGKGTVDRFLDTKDFRDLGRVPIWVMSRSASGGYTRRMIYIDTFGFQVEGLEFIPLLPLADAVTKYAHSISTKPMNSLAAIISETSNTWQKFVMSKAAIPMQVLVQTGEHIKKDPVLYGIATLLGSADPIAISSATRFFGTPGEEPKLTTSTNVATDVITKATLFWLGMLGARIRTASSFNEEAYNIWAKNTTIEQKMNGYIPQGLADFVKENELGFKMLGHPESKEFEHRIFSGLYQRYLKDVYNINVTSFKQNKALLMQIRQQAQNDPVLHRLLRYAKPKEF